MIVRKKNSKDVEEVENAVLSAWTQERSVQPAHVWNYLPFEPLDEFWTDNYYVHLNKIIGRRQVSVLEDCKLHVSKQAKIFILGFLNHHGPI